MASGAVVSCQVSWWPSGTAVFPGADPLVEAAMSACVLHVSVTLPDDTHPRPDGLRTALVRHADEAASSVRSWAATPLSVDGVVREARTWEFAGFSTTVSEVAPGACHLAVVAPVSVAPPAAVSVAAAEAPGVGDGRLDLTTLADARAATLATAGVRDEAPPAYHADHELLVCGAGGIGPGGKVRTGPSGAD